MTVVKKDKSGFSHFFKEDDIFIREVIQEITEQPVGSESAVQVSTLPVLPELHPAADDDRRTYWRTLRKFFSTGESGGLKNGLYPVVMAPQLTRSLIGLEYPVWINTGYQTNNDRALSRSLHELIIEALAKVDEQVYDVRILKDNDESLVRIANEELAGSEPKFLDALMETLRNRVLDTVEMGEKDRQGFTESFDRMLHYMPREGVVLPYSGDLPFQLLEAGMMAIQAKERAYLLEDIQTLTDRINDLVRIEKEKGAEGRDPEKLRESLGAAGAMLRVDALSSFLPDTGSKTMEPERLARIERFAGILAQAKEILGQRAHIVVEKGNPALVRPAWKQIFESSSLTQANAAEGCDTIEGVFRKEMGRCAELFAAVRAAELELEGKYQADLHDDYFARFTWENLTEEELHCCPFFVLIADAASLLEQEFQSLTGLLYENLPIKFLGMKTGLKANDLGKQPDLHSHHELTGMLLSHRNLFVSQTASITPSRLLEAFEYGMAAFAPAFFHVLDIDKSTHEHPMLITSAMIESRDFPGFIYAGLLGTPWGSRFNISNNPQSSRTWPDHDIVVRYPNGEEGTMNFPFTFADQAALFPEYQRFFQPVDPAYWTDDLVPVAEYMERHMEDNVGKVPFIWMVDQDNTLHQVAVSWQIIMAAEERRDHWRFLQENSGIHNFHVERAVHQLRRQLEEEQRDAIEQLKAAHQEEIARVRMEEADRVMENLTNALLHLDLTNAGAISSPAAKSPAPAKKAIESGDSGESAPEEKAPAKEAEPVVLVSEPYIDTALCTSCNECINVNSAMFKYNADKMAYIADAKAGTFEELVIAAENCPVSIIHPGAPLNPKEPGLDDLIERAKPYN